MFRSISRLLTASLAAFMAVAAHAGEHLFSVPLETERGVLAKLETAYVYNIARFVTWRADDAEVWLCLPAESPLLRYAQEIDARELGDGRRFRVAVADGSVPRCDIVFVHAALKSFPTALQSMMDVSHTLTISDRTDAISRGYVMQFFIQEDSVRFAVNTEVVGRAAYRVSSKLLRLARTLN